MATITNKGKIAHHVSFKKVNFNVKTKHQTFMDISAVLKNTAFLTDYSTGAKFIRNYLTHSGAMKNVNR